MASQLRPGVLNSVWRQRRDGWTDLEEAASRVAQLSAQARAADEPTGKVRDLLNLLDPIEHFWAFPGHRRFEQVRRLFSQSDFNRCARLVADINRALADETYRGAIASPLRGEDVEAEEAQAEQITPHRPYFEVLIVDDITPRQEQALREELRKLRRAENTEMLIGKGRV